MDRLNRTRLLFGDDAMKKLKSSTILVVGCGAVGSFAVEALARGTEDRWKVPVLSSSYLRIFSYLFSPLKFFS